MASGCLNSIGVSSETFIDCQKFHKDGWLSPRISFSRDILDKGKPKSVRAGNTVTCNEMNEESDSGASIKDFVDFEFRLEDPVVMLPADELFYEGKLVPLQLSVIRPISTSEETTFEVKSPETQKARRRNEISPTDLYLFSPKVPRCSSRWRDILGLKKLYQNSNKPELQQKTFSSDSSTNGHKYLKHFLHRNPKSSLSSSLDLSLTLPLLKDMESESVSASTSRLSHSSSSSGLEHDDLPRLSMDSDKPKPRRIGCQKTNNTNPPRLRVAKTRQLSAENPASSTRTGRNPVRRASETTIRGVSVDSPRMNSSGKIVFHNLERSSSSPSSLNGGPRYKHRGMERSYSANIRVTPVLNVPVCSLRGSSKSAGVFGLFSSTQRKEGSGGGVPSSGGRIGRASKGHVIASGKNRANQTVHIDGELTTLF